MYFWGRIYKRDQFGIHYEAELIFCSNFSLTLMNQGRWPKLYIKYGATLKSDLMRAKDQLNLWISHSVIYEYRFEPILNQILSIVKLILADLDPPL